MAWKALKVLFLVHHFPGDTEIVDMVTKRMILVLGRILEGRIHVFLSRVIPSPLHGWSNFLYFPSCPLSDTKEMHEIAGPVKEGR